MTKGEHEPGDPVVVFSNESYDGYELEVVRGDKPFQSDHYYGLLTLTDTKNEKVLVDKAEVGISLLVTIFGPSEEDLVSWYEIAENAILAYEAEHPERKVKKDIRSGEDAGANHEDNSIG